MKVGFVVFARDKAPWVRPCVRSILAQTYSPMTLVFSDQGSTDGTAEAMDDEARTYNGPNEILRLKCPQTELSGMPGLINHINWLHSQLDFDYWITIAADDIAYPDRVKRTMETIEELGRAPLFFGTSQHFATEAELAKQNPGGVTKYPTKSKWIEPIEHLVERVGGSSSNSWDPKLVESLYPLPHFSMVDVYLPFCAALVESFYMLAEVHHIYVKRPDPNNTGLEGRMRMAANEAERLRCEELSHFALLTNLYHMIERAKEAHEGIETEPGGRLEQTVGYLQRTILSKASEWSNSRVKLTVGRVPPASLPI